MELSIIIPVYNEQENLAEMLSATHESLQSLQTYELILVDDGSSDRSPQILKEFESSHASIRVIHHSVNLGKGEAVKTGVRAARYRYCLFLDADGSTTMQEWPAFEKRFERGAQVVIASRQLKDSKIEVSQPFLRRTLGGGYRALCRLIFGLKTSDFNCGFKAYQTDIAKDMYEKTEMKDWTFDVEIFLLLKRAGIEVVEVPVHWSHKKKKSNLAPIKTALKTVSSLFHLWRKYR